MIVLGFILIRPPKVYAFEARVANVAQTALRISLETALEQPTDADRRLRRQGAPIRIAFENSGDGVEHGFLHIAQALLFAEPRGKQNQSGIGELFVAHIRTHGLLVIDQRLMQPSCAVASVHDFGENFKRRRVRMRKRRSVIRKNEILAFADYALATRDHAANARVRVGRFHAARSQGQRPLHRRAVEIREHARTDPADGSFSPPAAGFFRQRRRFILRQQWQLLAVRGTCLVGAAVPAARCGASVPSWLAALYEGLDNDLESRKLVASAVLVEQVRVLREEGFDQFHFYTLNQAELTFAVCRILGIKLAKAVPA